MKVRYRLQAICTLRDSKISHFDFRGVPKCHQGFRLLGDEKLIVVTQPNLSLPALFQVKFGGKVWGGLLKGKNPVNFIIELPKLDHAFGQTFSLTMDCDNS